MIRGFQGLVRLAVCQWYAGAGADCVGPRKRGRFRCLKFAVGLVQVNDLAYFKYAVVHNSSMKIDLDPENLRVSMTLWRDAVDMKIPLKDEFKIHFMNQRQTILQKMTSTASAWLTLLRGCQAEGEDKAQLEKLQADVAAFQKWADDGLKELTDFADVK